MRYVVPFLSAIAFCTPVAAQTVDAPGAAALSETLARYFSKEAFDKGILKVSPDGDAYKIDLDFKALGALMPNAQAFKFDVSPYAVRTKPLPGGTWQVDGALFPNGWFESTLPQQQVRVDWSVTDGKMTGIFDPALAAWSSASATLGGMKVSTKDAMSQSDTTYGAGSFTMSATKAATGGVDVTAKQVFAGYNAVSTMRDPRGGADIPITMKMATVESASDGKGVRSKPILDLLAFFVANRDEAKIKAAQSELRAILNEGMPLWDHLTGTYSGTGLSVQTPVGELRAGKMGATFAMNGVQQNATIRYGMQLSEMKALSLLMPTWAPPLIPTEIDLNISAVNLNLESPARKAIESFDLNQKPPVPTQVTQEIVAELAANPPKLVIPKSTIRNAETTITAQGEVTYPKGLGLYDITVDATGFDKVVAALQAAATSDPQAKQMLQVAQIAEGLAKPEAGGRLVWDIDGKADGSVLVNGTMVKPASPVPLPAPPAPAPQ